MLTALLVGMPANTMPTAVGLALGANINSVIMTRSELHILTNIIIGAIFSTVTANVSKLRIFGFAREVREGLITGILHLRPVYPA